MVLQSAASVMHSHVPSRIILIYCILDLDEQEQSAMNSLPEAGFLRLSQIIGNPKATPPIPAIIPVSKSTWWSGVKEGRYPKPVKLSPKTTAWDVELIRAYIASVK